MRNWHSRCLARGCRVLETVAVAPPPGHRRRSSLADCEWESHQDGLPLPVGARWGRLTLEGPTARGSFGTVYRAFDSRMQIPVAVKLANSNPPSPRLNTHLLEEAARLSRVRHPSVVKMYGASTRGGRAGLCMELLDGGTLDRVLREEGLLDPTELMRIGCELCSALNAIHEAGLVHGDVKPQNVARLGTGRVVMIDFGSASEASRPARSGTPLYLAPEVLQGRAPSAASDIYSLGVLLFHLVSGDHPVRGDSIEQLRREQPPAKPLKAVRPDLGNDLCDVVDRALRRDPAARFGSAIAMRRALACVSRGSLQTVAGAA